VRNLRKFVSLAAVIAVLMGASGCQLISKTPDGEKKTVVAKVGNEKITKGEFDKEFAVVLKSIENQYGKDFANTKEGQDLLKSQKEQYVDQMINNKLILQKGKELNVIPDDKTIDDKTNEMIDGYVKSVGGEDKFKEQVKQALDMSLEDYKKIVKETMKVQLIEEKLYENATKGVSVKDDEVKNYYNENLYSYTEKPNKLYFSHILLNTEEEAKKVKKELDAGGNFAELAKKYSQDPGSKDNGGEYKEGLEYAKLDKAFLAGALTLPIGKISEPVKASYGYHLIKVNKKEEYTAKSFDTVKEDIKNNLLGQKKGEKYSAVMEEWKKKADVKKYPENL
jgi:foldase protein PrsA